MSFVASASAASGKSWAAAHLLVATAGAGLLAYTAYRANALSFTHDESLSYLFHVSRSYWSVLTEADTANNHLLNTLSMKASASLFGAHPFALRLPNLLAHVLYLGFSWLWLRLFDRPAVLIAGFVILNLNPYLLDFFSLARGYGIAVSLTMASIYFMTRALRSDGPGVKMEVASLAAGALAVLASYTLLNFYLALLVAFNLAAIGRRQVGMAEQMQPPLGLFLLRRNWPAAIVSCLLAALTFAPVMQLAGRGQLYYGGTDGLWSDTVVSLINQTLYRVPADGAGASALGWLVVAILAGSLLSIGNGLRKDWARTLASPQLAVLAVLGVAAASTIVQHYGLDTRYLTGRTALFFVPLWVATGICLWTTIPSGPARRLADGLAGALAIASLVHTVSAMNGADALDWRYDASTKGVVDYLEEQQGAKTGATRVGVHWRFGPTMLFYRETLDLRWLVFAENADTHHSDLGRAGFPTPMDYYYVFDDDLASIEQPIRRVRRFAATNEGTATLYRAE